MTDSRPAKLARLQELKRSVPYVSKSALAAILKDIEKNRCLVCIPGNIYWNLQKQLCTLEPGLAHCFNNGKLRTVMAPLARSG